MADEQQASAAQGEQAPQFSIQRIYLKDMSLELPNAPQIFLEASAPSVEIQLDITNEVLGEGVHETAVRVTVTAKMADKVAFLVEATQAGIFTSQGIGGEQMEAVANILCPSKITAEHVSKSFASNRRKSDDFCKSRIECIEILQIF